MPCGSDISSEVRRYMELRIDEIKLKAVDGLSVGVSGVLALMAIMAVGAIALIAIAFGSMLLLGEAVGSLSLAAFIIAGFFLLLLVFLIILRKKLFLNLLVRLFISIFYEQ